MSRKMYLNGIEVIAQPGWSISDKINARSTISFTVETSEELTIREGHSILYLNGTDKLFSGIVYSFSDSEAAPGVLEYKISGVDNCAIADRRVIADTIENQTAGWIIENKILPILEEEGVTAGSIEQGPMITKANFAYITCTEALDYLKELTGLNWNIDFDKKLQFFRRDQNKAPFILNHTTRHDKFKRSRKYGAYRNTQYVRAGKGETTPQENESPSPAPDGQSRSFVLRFPLATRPVIELNVNNAGWIPVEPSKIGIKGLDEGKQWYFQYDSNVISQDEAETVLKDSEGGTRVADRIRVTYTGLYPILALVNRPEEINTRKSIEPGTSGIYEHLVKETSLNTADQAIEFGNGQIDTYGNIPDTVEFNTEVKGLRAGQLLTINKPLFKIDEAFLIESIKVSRYDQETETYAVKCLDGSALGGWEQFFRKLVKGNRELVIGENEAVIVLNSQSETENRKGLIYVNPTITGLFPSNTLYPSNVLYPNEIIVAEETLYD